MTDLVLEIFRVNGALLEAGNRLTAPHGLSSARWQVMGAIELAGQPMTVAQIARRMGLTRQGVQRIANDLEAMKMVRFEENMDHKRAKLVVLTTKGARVMARIDEAQIAWVNALSDDLSDRTVKQSLKLLGAVRERLEAGNSAEKHTRSAIVAEETQHA